MIEDPGEFTIVCDKCGTTINIPGSQYCGSPTTWGVESSQIEDQGWTATSDDEHYCEDCANNMEDEDE